MGNNSLTNILNKIESIGNRLPHPALLFLYMSISVVFISALASFLGLAVDDPRPAGSAGRADNGLIEVVSLLNQAGFQRIMTELVKNFVLFAPLGTVLVALLGVGIAEKSGLIEAVMKRLVLGASPKMVTVMVIFAGILSNTAGELGYVVLIPLAALIFQSLGRHPLAGLAAAFAGVSGGYSANLLLGAVDPVLSGITEQAAQLIAPGYEVGPQVNWYFMFASVFVITGLGYWVTQYIVEPKLGESNAVNKDLKEELKAQALTSTQIKALKYSGLSAVLVLVFIALTIVPSWGILRHIETGQVSGSPFFKSIVAFIFIFFAVTGITYGKIVGQFKSSQDIVNAMIYSMSTMSAFLVLVFFSAQFVAYFNWTNLGAIIAVLGAQALQAIELSGPLVIALFIMICASINIFLGSASAQWAVTAPIFVPMLMLLGYSPELIQAAYRIGDSSTNIITPMMSYFGLILAVAERYQPRVGMGTIIAMMLPYSVVFLIAWTVVLLVWVFALGLPVGPDAPLFYKP